MDDYVLLQKLLDAMKSRMPVQLRVSMDVARALSAAGIQAASQAYFDESSRWFSLARTAANVPDPASALALTSCVASAESYLDWRTGDFTSARAKIRLALESDITLETRHHWHFLLPQRLHYSHLMARTYFAEGDGASAIRHVFPGASMPELVPDSTQVAAHIGDFPENRPLVAAALRRMAGEIAIAVCTSPALAPDRPGLREMSGPLLLEEFRETIELLDAIRGGGMTGSHAALTQILSRGRGKTIAWYAAVFHAQRLTTDQALRGAIAARTARWSDIPAPLRQGIIRMATPGHDGN